MNHPLRLLIGFAFSLFTLSAFAQAPATWQVDPSQYQFNSSVTGVLIFDGFQINNPADRIAAFHNGEIRGVAAPFAFQEQNLYFLTVNSNVANGEEITFQAYIGSEDQVVNIEQTVIFQANDILGNPLTPFRFEAFANFDFPPEINPIPDQIIEIGQQFSSFDLDDFLNSRDSDPVTWSVAGNTELIVSVDGQNMVSVTLPNPNWIGEENITFTATETTANQFSASETVLFKRRNTDAAPVLSVIPEQKKPLNGTFANLNLPDFLAQTDGDPIAWSIAYDRSAGTATNPNWSVNPADFQFTMNIIAEVVSKGVSATNANQVLGAFSGTELRGVATGQQVGNKWVYFLTVGSNVAGQPIRFQFFDSELQQVLPIDFGVNFQANATLGTAINPVTMKAAHVDVFVVNDTTLRAVAIDPTWIGTEKVNLTAQETGTVLQLSDSQPIDFTVFNDTAPTVSGIPNQEIELGGAFTVFDLDDFLTNPDGDPISWAFSGNDQLTVTVNAFNQVTVTPPNATWLGTEVVTFRAVDQTAQNFFGSQAVRFRVRTTDEDPVFTAIPDQQIGIGETFEKMDLASRLTVTDGDSVVWNYAYAPQETPSGNPNWQVNPFDYQFTMNLIGKVNSLGVEARGNNNILAAFKGDELRGVSETVYIAALDVYLYYISIYTNSETDTISFRFFDSGMNHAYPVKESFRFQTNEILGNPLAPFELTAGNILVEIDENQVADFVVVDPEWSGKEAVTITAQDFETVKGLNASQTFDLIVLNDYPALLTNIPDQTVNFGQNFQTFDLDDYLTLGDTDPYSYSFSENTELVVSIDGNNVVTVAKPNAEWAGIENIIFTVTENTLNMLSDDDTVRFRGVSEDNAPVLANIADQKTGLGGSFVPVRLPDFTTEPDGDAVAYDYTFISTSGPDARPAWSVNPNNFESSMGISAEVVSLGDTIETGTHLLGAFIDNQLRGTGQITNLGAGIVQFNFFIYGDNPDNGKEIRFQFFDEDEQRLLPIKQKFTFQTGNNFIGSIQEPVFLQAGLLLVNISEAGMAAIEIVDPELEFAEQIEWKVQDTDRALMLSGTQTATYTVADVPFPVVGDIPDQVIAEGGSFSAINLNSFLSEVAPADITWSVDGNRDLGVAISASGVASFSIPNENYNGAELLTFIATMNNDPLVSASDDVLMTVLPENDQPIFTSLPLTEVRVNQNYQYAVTATDVDQGDVLTIEAEIKPTWLALEAAGNGLAILSGTPTEINAGFHTVRLKVTDVQGLFSRQTFQVFVNIPPVITSTPATIVNEDELYRYVIVTEDDNINETIVVNTSTLPSWLSLEVNGNGVYSLIGTPTNADVGEYPISITVNDNVGDTDTQNWTITVVNTNDLPAFQSSPVLTVAEGDAYTYSVLATDIDTGDAVTLSAPTLPAWLTFSNGANGSGTLSGTPQNAQVGTHEVVLRATDLLNGQTDQAFIITVINVNQAPFFTNNGVETATEDVEYTATLRASDADAGDVLTFSAPTLPTWLQLTDNQNGTATLRGTPLNENVGSNTVGVQVTDAGGLTAALSFDISVANTNDAPLFSSAPLLAATEDALYGYSVMASDVDMGDALSLTAATLPAWLSFNDNGDGTGLLSGTPTNAEVGVHNVVLQVTDAAGSLAEQAFSISVINTNDVPFFITPAPMFTNEDALFQLLFNTDDEDATDVLTLTAPTLPLWLTFNDNGNGTALLSGTPSNENVGSNPIVLTVTDAAGASSNLEFDLVVINVNDAPVFTSVAVTGASEGTLYQYNIATADVDDLDSRTLTATVLPAWLTFADNGDGTALLSGTPSNANVGNHAITLTVTDAAGATAEQTFQITVSNVNTAPVFTSAPILAINEEQPYSYAITATDADAGETLTIAAEVLPVWLTLNGTGNDTATLSGLPTNANVGFHFVRLRVTDALGTTDLQEFTITVLNVNDAPVFSSAPLTIAFTDVLYSYAVQVNDVDLGDVATVTAEQIPAWLSFEQTGAVYTLSGTPTVNQVGSTNIRLLATDTQGATAAQNFTLFVNLQNETPVINSTPVTTVNEDEPYFYQIESTDANAGDILSVNVTPIPAWLSLETIVNGIARLEGTPTNANVGSYDLEVRVTDIFGATTFQPFSITVLNVNDAPVFTSAPLLEVNEDALYRYELTAADVDQNDEIAFSATLPQWLSLSEEAGSFFISGTPTNAEVGTHEVTATVSDLAGDREEQVFTVTVLNVNDAPMFTSLPISQAFTDVAYSYSPTATDIDLEDVVSLSATQFPAWLTAETAEGLTLTGTPALADLGEHLVEIVATDLNGGTATQAFTLVVSLENLDPQIISNPTTLATEEISYRYTVVADDANAGDVITFTAETLPTWLNLTDNANNTAELEGTPTNAEVGTHEVSIRATDFYGLSVTQTFTITVANVNDAPVFTSDPITTTQEDALYAYTITAADQDAGDVLALAALNLPAWLTFSDNGDGTALLSGTPTNAEVGSYPVVLQVTDAAGATALQSFEIEVANTNDFPFFTSEPVETATENELYQYLITFEDPDVGDVLTLEVQSLPSWLSLTPIDDRSAQLEGTPTDGDVGEHEVSFTVGDQGAFTVLQFFTITVSDVNNAPTLIELTGNTLEENRSVGAFIGTFATTDPDQNDSFTYALPAGMEDNDLFSVSENQLLSANMFDFEVGSEYSISVIATDLGGATVEGIFSIRIQNVNEAPTISEIFDLSGETETTFAPITISISDPESDPSDLVVSVTSSNEAVIPLSGMVLSGTGSERSLTVTASETEGETIITVTVTDGQLSASESFRVTTVAPNVLSLNDNWKGELTLYPNPAIERLNIRIGNDFTGDLMLSLYDATGKKLLSRVWNKRQFLFNESVKLDRLKSGVYVLHLTAEGERIVRRVVVR